MTAPRSIFNVMNMTEIANFTATDKSHEKCSVRTFVDHEATGEDAYLELGDMEVTFTLEEVEAATPCKKGGKSWYIMSDKTTFCVDFLALVAV